MIGLAVCSTIMSGIVIVLYLVALAESTKILRCPGNVNPTLSSYDSICRRYHGNSSWHVTFTQAEIDAVSSCFLIIAAAIEFFLALVTSMYACNAWYNHFYSQVSYIRLQRPPHKGGCLIEVRLCLGLL